MDPCEETARVRAAAVLGITPEAGVREINRAYRRLMRKHHPDTTGLPQSEALQRIQDAYTVLTRNVADQAVLFISSDSARSTPGERARSVYAGCTSPEWRPTLDVWA